MERYWIIDISQNDWEYSGWIKVKAKNVIKVSDRVISIDGLIVEFDESINIRQNNPSPTQ